jgi:fatty-acyl-CoA synthase
MSLVVAPLFHIAALAMISLPTLVKGGTVLVRPTFDPAGALELIASRGVTQMFGVPTMFNAMAKTEEWEGTDLSGLRSVMCGGAPVPTATIDTYLARGVVFIQGYGMTETSPGLLFLDGPSSTVKAGTAGVPSFFTDVRLVGPDMDDAEPGERGEILAAGPNVMKGYWGRPKETGAAFSDGTWFHTGDVAIVDPDGYYTIVDRTKDIIISGGENIYPAEVEDAILHHPAVAECAVFGVPDERWGEVGRAVVVLREGAALDEPGLLAHLDTRLARYKIPKSVVFTDELPKSGAGKVLKPQLRRRFGAGA